MKEKDSDWVPHTPAKPSLEPEIIKKSGGSDGRKKEVDESSTTPRKRKKMKKHRPKVVNESKPLKPLTPKPRTPKPVKRKPKAEKNEVPVKSNRKRKPERKDDDSRRKQVCRRELNFNDESCDHKSEIVNDEQKNGIVKKKRSDRKGVCRRELKFNVESCDQKSGRVKKKRMTRQRLSIPKLIRLVAMIHRKWECESRILNLTCINSKRKRSRRPTKCRKDLSVFLPIGPQVQSVDDQLEHQGDEFSPHGNGDGPQVHPDDPLGNGNRNGPQVQTVNQCEHQVDANVETCSAEFDIIQDDAFKEALVDYATQRMESLHLEDHKIRALQVVDQKSRAIQVVDQALDPKQRRPKVDLDEETIRVWKLLTFKNEGEAANEGQAAENVSESLAKERELFTTLVTTFNSMMRELTGDRRFSRWKGSVIDSIVGVFLTQNVGDNLSSNAFMTLAARYPPPSVREQNGSTNRIDSMVSESRQTDEPGKSEESDSNNPVEILVENGNISSRKKKDKVKNEQENQIDWDELRKNYSNSDAMREDQYADLVDWKAVRRASEEEIAKVIEERGMSNQLAKRIKNFLDRMVRDHNSLDLEWLRNAPPDKVKDYLLSIDGLGLKSTECVRLLSLLQPAFPIDVNAARFLVRVGWVKLQPLPDGLQIHNLNDYPELGSVQKFVWPRISHIHKLILYENHCYVNIFSKSFCTKTNPKCNVCPMRGECKHYASAVASSRLHLEDSRDKNMSSEHNRAITNGSRSRNEEDYSVPEPIIEYPSSPEPVIEFPPSPGPAPYEPLGGDIEDFGCDTQIPTIILSSQESSNNPPYVVDGLSNSTVKFLSNPQRVIDDVSNAMVALDPQDGSIPMPKRLKFVERLRTLILVYVLPDTHPLLVGFEKRVPEDPCPYLLAISDQESSEGLKEACSCVGGRGSTTCGACTSEIVEHKENNNVKGTILIPCRTANRGGFPLNGTYFQINEVFADHETSKNPIDVTRALIWNLDKRILYCGTSITSICKGMSLEQVMYCFQKGYICIRGFDMRTRCPKPLASRFHFCKSRQSVIDV